MKNRLHFIVVQFVVLLVLLGFAACIQLKDSVVDENEYLGNRQNDIRIYGAAKSDVLLNPFRLNTNNWDAGVIERLMLVEFKPLANYRSIELQIIEKDGNEGAMVILYYDGESKADIYFSPHLALTHEMYAPVLNDVELTASDFEYGFEEKNGCLKIHLSLTDRFGNKILMDVDEQNPQMEPASLLAPIGGEAKEPEFMTLVFMKHFRFVAADEEKVSVDINGQPAELIKLPVKVNGIKGLQTKYSMDMVSLSWNKNFKGVLAEIPVNIGGIADQGFELKIIENQGFYEITSLIGRQDGHELRIRFSPPIPQLNCLAGDLGVEGRFTLGVDEIGGIIAGEYELEKIDGNIYLEIEPKEGYSPVPGKAWMKKMEWEAQISDKDGAWQMKSAWEKK